MSVDLSSITEIRDKIGVVTKITDASGMVLWKVAPATVTVIMQSDITGNYSFGLFTVGYHTADSYYSISSAGTYNLPVGTVIEFTVKPNKEYSGAIFLNDETVASGSYGDSTDYTHTLTDNIIIDCMANPTSGFIYITKVPKGQIIFTIDSTTYFAQENMTWENWFASSHNTTGKTADDVSTITDSNGNTVNLTDVIVNGTAYEVGFAPSEANVKITTPDSTNASFPNIIINGVNYNDTSTEYELVVPIGTIAEVGGYYLNGTYVSGNYTIMGDVEIQRYTHVTPPSPPTSFSPTVTVRINIIEL